MPQMMAFIPLIASIAGPLLGKVLGGSSGGDTGSNKSSSNIAAGPAAGRNLFQPDQIKQATDKYSSQGTAKWNQILAGMGAGGGLGGPDVPTQIGQQANQMGTALGQLNTDSGYGDNPMSNLDAILKGVEGGISPKYSVF